MVKGSLFGKGGNNVAYPFSTICLAIALLVGIGSASSVSLCLGRKEPKSAKAAEMVLFLMGIFGIIYLLVGETFLSLLQAFGATTDVFPYAKQYASITLIGMPFLIVTNGMSNLIRANGKPKYSMVCMVMGAIINTILDPIFIFACDWGIAGAAWQQLLGKFFPSYSHSVIYGVSKQSILKKSRFYWTSKKHENLQHGNQQALTRLQLP